MGVRGWLAKAVAKGSSPGRDIVKGSSVYLFFIF